MASPKKIERVLVESAAALETELERYELRVANARRLEMSSEEGLLEARTVLETCAATEQRLREHLQGFSAAMQRQAEGAGDAELALALGEVVSRADAVLADAEAVANDARERDWEDIAREAAALKQQLQAARNSVLQAQLEMAGRAPS
jgi:hypothetical protein